MKATAKLTRGKTASKTVKYYEAKIELLEEENEILRNSLDELKSELETARKREELAKDDTNCAWDYIHEMERVYITARALVNIPDNIKDLVFELIKTRFLLWGEHLEKGSKEIYEIEPENSDFVTILPPAETLRKNKGKSKKPV